MANLYKMSVGWSGLGGGPATTTLYSSAIHNPTAVKAFFTAVKALLPIGLTWTIPGRGDILNDANGTLTGEWSTGADLTEVSSAVAAAYSAPSGAVVRFTTATIVNGHRVKGRMFLVPLTGNAYENNGTLSGANVTLIQTAGAALISAYAASLAVWARPFEGRAATGTLPAIPARAGSTAIITGAQCPDKAAVLRSRRD